ncbi:NUDIX hydrolase [Plasticicumulans acidivorans]|uniref:8-oxo-dGTP diphosphatase n=1 Tax=Plasticicumulans acidivorans TaxID=886464 RepID=A0A317MTB4_9GAMM|nr:NUDIX domain-containing protein [Plasticicumulans acidivorans]PWV60579.1 8-oxo-dGTP diphosphatase [Plasticicumulans acidivorans]
MRATLLPVSVHIVVFGIRCEGLAVLLLPRAEMWSLPGGGVEDAEDIHGAALRQLAVQTGLRDVYMEQLYTFDHLDADTVQRTVAVTWYALVPSASSFTKTAAGEWFAVEALPALPAEQAGIVHLARQRLAAKLEYSTIALQLMPERFTLGVLQAVHETVLGTALDKRNFRKRVLAWACIEETGEMAREGHHRPARLYRVTRPGSVEIIK